MEARHLNEQQEFTPAAPPVAAGPSKLGYLVGVAIFVVFVVLVEVYFGWAKLLAPWAHLAPLAVAAAVLVVFLSYGLRALRIYYYFREEMRGAYLGCLKLFLQHNVLNNLLPMRSGELSFPVLMSRYFSIAPVRSVPTLFWFRLLDLHTLLGVGLVLSLSSANTPLLAIAAVVCWLPAPWVAYLVNNQLLRYLRRRDGGGKLHALLIKALDSLPQSPRAFWVAWGWTLLNWIVKLAAFAWVLSSFVDVSLLGAWIGVIGGDLTSVLPVHGVAGVATYEAGVVAALLPFDVAADRALQAAINLHLFLLGTAVIAGAASLFFPLRRKQRAAP
jgi:uncharacterized membrane protein YbhN (UPF0104 family)